MLQTCYFLSSSSSAPGFRDLKRSTILSSSFRFEQNKEFKQRGYESESEKEKHFQNKRENVHNFFHAWSILLKFKSYSNRKMFLLKHEKEQDQK